jgi:hypothetical protein
MSSDFDASFARVLPTMLAITTAAQTRVAAGAQDYIPAVLEDTRQTRAITPVVAVQTSPLIGVAGDGRPVDTLLYGAVTTAKTAVGEGASTYQALRSGGDWLSMAVGTLLSDTGRASESLGMGVRPVSGYVRMLEPPSCSRCTILAGKWSRKSTAFLRHPRCDCRNIPASESVGNDLTVNPAEYFDSLSAEDQARIFTNAGAEAIRNGADIGQVVNARRGMYSAQIGGRDVQLTREGVTRRGYAYKYLRQSAGQDVKVAGSRYSRAVRPRLMPETIQRVATDQADYLRLLRANGYLR